MFGTILISIITIIHIYVFWRASSVPFIRRHVTGKTLIIACVLLWGLFYLGRVVGHHGTGAMAAFLEFTGMNWMATVFLIFTAILCVDIATVFGFFMRRMVPALRGGALIAGIVLSLIALFQGLRPPVIQNYDVSLSNLPAEMDGTVLVAMSDLHLGSLTGEKWLAARIAQVQAQQPDLIVLLGDIFEGHGPPAINLLSEIQRLSAPLGVWAVSGNHEFHGHNGSRMAMLEKTGFSILRNQWIEALPGFVIAGVDDLTSQRRKNHETADIISKTLIDRPPGITVFLSHTPWETKKASDLNVDLMLCGHTHGGQIWPFSYLVRHVYPLIGGRYNINGMTVIVCRGTGTWGPRMRLWRPGEILRITLKSKKL